MNNLKKMKLADNVLFYHSQEGNCVMGTMKVVEEAHQDPTTSDSKWVSVTFEPVESFDNLVSLKQIKENKELKNIGIIKQPRLAIIELEGEEFEKILVLSRNK